MWNKQHHYESAFYGWDMRRVAAMTEAELDALVDKTGPWAGKLIQNRAKLSAIIHNAGLCVQLDEKHEGGLAAFLWSFVDGHGETVNQHSDCRSAEYEQLFGTTSKYSDAMARALKKPSLPGGFGFKFLGSITLQAFMLQNGLLNGHGRSCPKNPHSMPTTPPSSQRSTKRAVESEDELFTGERTRHCRKRSSPADDVAVVAEPM